MLVLGGTERRTIQADTYLDFLISNCQSAHNYTYWGRRYTMMGVVTI